MDRLVKVGYVRIIHSMGNIDYISYNELASYDAAGINALRSKLSNNSINMVCACCAEDTLELSITAANVIRVKSNGLHELHAESCPKSISYSNWVKENSSGIMQDEDGLLTFNISIPSANKSTSGTTQSRQSEPKSDREVNHRTPLLDMVKTINAVAWERQTYSKKKEISLAHKRGEKASWSYKSNEEFIRLIFGIANDIQIVVGKKIDKLSSICYKAKEFYNDEEKRRWFIYVEIEKISPVKLERKYQYVTVKMPSNQSNKKAVIRVKTEDYKVMFENLDEEEGTHRMLAGYVYLVRHNYESTVSEWITLLKGIAFYTSRNGLYAYSKYEANIINQLCEEKVLFKKPYQPIENYGSEIPFLLLERLNNKNRIIDVCYSEKELESKTVYAENNKEYECNILENGAPIDINELL